MTLMGKRVKEAGKEFTVMQREDGRGEQSYGRQ